MTIRSKHNVILIVLFLFVFVSLYYATHLRIYHDLEAFFPQNDPDLAFFEQHRNRFEADDNFVTIGLPATTTVFDSTFLAKVDSFTKTCDTISGVNTVLSLTNFKNLLSTPLGFTAFPVLHTKNPAQYQQDSLQIFNDERLVGRYIAKDAKAVAVFLKHEDQATETVLKHIINSIDKIAQEFGFEDIKVGGRAKMVSTVINSVEKEFVLYGVLAALLTMVVMTLLLQRFWGVVLALIATFLGLTLFLGFLGLVKFQLDVMSPLFPTLLIIVGMSDVIHILSKYFDEINKGKPKKAAIRIALKEIGLATFLTSFTTAIGFASLYSSNIQSIQSFGIYAAIGVLITYVAVVIFMAATLARFKPEQLTNMSNHANFWNRLLNWVYTIVQKQEKAILLISFFVLVGCLIGIAKIPTNVYMLADIPDNAKLRKDLAFFEENLSGIRTFEVAILPTETYKVNDLQVLQEVEKLVTYLNSIEEIGPLYSPLTIYKSLHKAYRKGYELPNKQALIKKYDRQIKKMRDNGLNLLISEDKKYARISGTMKDIGSDKVDMLNEEINNWVATNIATEKVQFRLTGTALLIDKNHVYLRSSLFTGLGFAFLVVSIIMALWFRDIKMVVIALIPNTFPLLIAGGIMGLLGISLKASTSIIFTIAFGIAVDDTIHFLSKFKLQLNKGNTIDEAIRITLLETGKAICLTTIILFFGFLLLIFSEFKATYYVGLLVSITLLSALVADFFLLPICLKRMLKEKTK